MVYSVHRGIVYFQTFQEARSVRDSLSGVHPGARVVGYQRGYAIQREKSGPYLCTGETTPASFSFR